MKSVFTSLALLIALYAQCQTTFGPTNDSLYLGFNRDSISKLDRPTILITPFHPNRYLSNIDRDIAKGTNYTFQHTRGFFRKGLDNALIIAAKEYNDYVNLHADVAALNHDLDFFYKVVTPSVVPYEPPLVKETQNFKGKLAHYWEKIHTNVEYREAPGGRIERGEVVSVADHRELITKAKVVNPILFDSLTPKHNVDYYISINEMNIFNAAGSQTELELEDFDRIIKVHYTVFDKDGRALYSLISKRFFSSKSNDLPTIIQDEILPIGYSIVYSLDSYRFLKAGLAPINTEEEKKNRSLKLLEMPTLRKN